MGVRKIRVLVEPRSSEESGRKFTFNLSDKEVKSGVIHNDDDDDKDEDKSEDSRRRNLYSGFVRTSVVVTLKQKIESMTGIPPTMQRLSIEGNNDEFAWPWDSRVRCKQRTDRNPRLKVLVRGWNCDCHSITVDPESDNILDLKYELSSLLLIQSLSHHSSHESSSDSASFTSVSEVVKHLQITIDNCHMNRNCQLLRDSPLFSLTLPKILGSNDDRILTDINQVRRVRVAYWLEIPQLSQQQTITHGPSHRTSVNLFSFDPDWPTIAHSLRRQGRLHPSDPHLGYRRYLDPSNPIRLADEYHWMTFGELNHKVSLFASGLRSLLISSDSHSSSNSIKDAKGVKIGICAENRLEWSIADYSCHCQSMITVPLYSTLSKNAIEFIVNDAEIEAIICSVSALDGISPHHRSEKTKNKNDEMNESSNNHNNSITNLSSIRQVFLKRRKKCPSLKYVIIMDEKPSDRILIDQRIEQAKKRLRVQHQSTLNSDDDNNHGSDGDSDSIGGHNTTINNNMELINELGFTHRMSEIEDWTRTQHASPLFADVMPLPSSIACICYTSGTTGNPKGVMLTHSNLMSTINSWYLRTPKEFLCGNEDCVLSYLPLAHVYARQTELMALRSGAKIGYFSGYLDDRLLEDMQLLKPTVFTGVPRVYQKIQDGILKEITQNGSFFRRWIFDYAMSEKLKQLDKGELTLDPQRRADDDHTSDKDNTYNGARRHRRKSKNKVLMPDRVGRNWWDKLVFDKVKQRFGGRLRAASSGAAPLSEYTARFLRIAFSPTIGEGYGLTETSAGGTTMDHYDTHYGHVGSPLGCNEVKLVSVPEMEYHVYDSPMPRGEVWIRGSNVFNGYWNGSSTDSMSNDDNNNNEAFPLNDGWFATGDIGQWREDGKLEIIDRKKNIFKLSQGEYVRSEHIEGVYKLSPFIEHIFVYGDSNADYLVAIVCPDFIVLNEYCRKRGILDELSLIMMTNSSTMNNNNNNNDSIMIISDELKTLMLRHGRVQRAIALDMARVARQESLNGFEQIREFDCIIEPFTVENGMLTATMKLRRHYCRRVFADRIRALYARQSSGNVTRSKL